MDTKPKYVLRITGFVPATGKSIPLSHNFYWCGRGASSFWSTRYHNAIRYVSLEVAQLAAKVILDYVKETYSGITSLELHAGEYEESTGNEWVAL